jgi:hypothetical protein
MPASRRSATRLALGALALAALTTGVAAAGGAPAPPSLPLPPGGMHNTPNQD